MNTRSICHLLAAASVGLGLAIPTAQAESDKRPRHHATIIDTHGQAIGMVTLEEVAAGVLVRIDAEKLEKGEHAFHIHETGICDPGDGFSSAGGHFAPSGNAHGLRDPAGYHAGDMPNQFVGADGRLRAEVLNSRISMEKQAGNLADHDGSALVIHAGADDYLSQPSGAAGSRVACAVISVPKE